MYRYSRLDPELPVGADVERFWSYVRRGDINECWPWRTNEPGTFWWIDSNSTRVHQASYRLSYRLANDGADLPSDRVIAHSCDNPPCCNPHHLSLKTQSENVLEAVERGRHPSQTSESYKRSRENWWVHGKNGSGEDNASAKLTNSQVAQIRERYKTGEVKQTDLAKEYGVGQSTISRIIRDASYSR
ncbi:MAG: hypothetical protein ACRDRL_13585 [Sciscionella sp.]